MGGWVGGVKADNNATQWPYLASWILQDFQLGWLDFAVVGKIFDFQYLEVVFQ